jgi:hypothetical protein
MLTGQVYKFFHIPFKSVTFSTPICNLNIKIYESVILLVGVYGWHAWGRGEVLTWFWLGGPKVRDRWEDLGVGGRITLSCTFGR